MSPTRPAEVRPVSRTMQDPPVALGPPGADDHVVAARGGPPVDRADVVADHVLAQRVELGALPADQRRVLAVELAQPGQLGGQVLARRGTAAAPGPTTAPGGSPGGRPARAGPSERTVTVAASGRRAGSGVERGDEPAALARRARRAAGAAARRPARGRPGVAEHGRAPAGGPGSPRSARPSTCLAEPHRPCRPSGAKPQRAARCPASSQVDRDAAATTAAPTPAPRPGPGAGAEQHDHECRSRRQQRPAPSVSAMAQRGTGTEARTPSSTPSAVAPSSSASGRSWTRCRSVGPGQRLDVVGGHVVAARQPGPGPRRGQQRRRAARRDAELQRRRLPGGPAQVDDVAEHLGGDVHLRAPPRGPAARSAAPATGRDPARPGRAGRSRAACRSSTAISSSRGGSGTVSLSRKRSSCASGSG